MNDDTSLLALLRRHLPDASETDAELLAILDDAASLICALTWRLCVPEPLRNAQVRLAVVMYNRRGMEGESEHTEGDVRRGVSGLPAELRTEIYAYRMARVGL